MIRSHLLSFTEVMFGVKRRPINVQMSTIDAEVASGTQPPEFIKIDVEGHDLNVLKSLDLSKYRPKIIVIEMHSIEDMSQNEIYQYLVKNDFVFKFYAVLNAYFVDAGGHENH